MANQKISALPAASTPLAGTEVLPIVQGGTTDQVSVANLTAGRDISAKVITATDNVVISTAGKGIDFSANTHATGMTSELLTWYEEGNYTPTVTAGSGSITSFTATAWYTRIGREVTVIANVAITNAGTGAGVCTISLPFTNNATVIASGTGRENAITGSQLQGSVALSANTMDVRQFNNATIVATGAQIRINVTYFV
jgi:hypothetical protein